MNANTGFKTFVKTLDADAIPNSLNDIADFFI